MEHDAITILLGFVEGFTLILSLCVLSILPILLAGSLVGSKKRSFGIIIGFIFFSPSFFFFGNIIYEATNQIFPILGNIYFEATRIMNY